MRDMVRIASMLQVLWWSLLLGLLLEAALRAYEIRLWAIKDYGAIIHEFDPWFNYRATEYLAEHGWKKFFTWFDHQSWYPLGRPVATTIYPGMQITAVFLWRLLQEVDNSWDLNHVCCYMPAWFGAVSSVFAGLLASESVRGERLGFSSVVAGGVAARAMAVVPAHLSRSVGGGFDNESVAISAMCCSFFFWCRALRNESSWPIAALAGLAYSYMAASWGGYIFALNMIGLHAGILTLCGSAGNLYAAYSLFFVVGTVGAMQVPVVSWTPLRSMEQLGPLALFGVYKLLPRNLKQLPPLVAVGAVGVVLVGLLIPSGIFSPFSARVAALFVKHTKTGNPLVDSVAEHQPGSADAYWNYLGKLCLTSPMGLVPLLLRRSDGAIFLVALFWVTYFFAQKMRRLIIFMALPASTLTGAAASFLADFAIANVGVTLEAPGSILGWINRPAVRLLRILLAALACYGLKPQIVEFLDFCEHKARWTLSHPQIVTKGKDGSLIDDYRQAYTWLKDNTPEDARVMAWWDYGYQIAGIANRTTIADGNTWNHEHIALLGLCLSSPSFEAHKIARHLADYVLVWAGGGGKDDVGKSKHMARIANSVYPGHCNEEDCDLYGVFPDGKPSKMMEASLIYRLCGRGALDPRHFREVFVSRHRRVRIAEVLQVSEESRSWRQDLVTSGRNCDAIGSWYCPGGYSPGLLELFDPNSTGKEALEYREAYAARVQEQWKEKPQPNQEGLPPGSYLNSCRGCSMSGKTLTCTHCRLPGSPSLQSSLEPESCPLPQINNIQGRLQCEPKPNAHNIPPGGYQQSCKGCEMRSTGEEETLFCSHCSSASGNQVPTSFEPKNCPKPAKLDNDNGKLVCNGVTNDAACPDGPYLQSCQGCHLSGSVVVCPLCRRADGRQMEASHSMETCTRPARLENQDGRLVCSGAIDGPYKKSCSQCQQTGDFLTCQCGQSTGKSLESSYDISRCRSPAELHNLEGRLTCQGVPNGRGLPQGPYLETCQGCHLVKESLTCSHCLNDEGRQVESSMVHAEVASCVSQQLKPENLNGLLRCLRLSAEVGRGACAWGAPVSAGAMDPQAMLQALAALDDQTLLAVITGTLKERPELAPGVVNGAVPDLTYAPADSLTKRRATGRILQVNSGNGVGFIDCPELKAVFQTDVYVHKNQVGALPIGTEVNFAILLSKDMKPQAFDLQPTGASQFMRPQGKGLPGLPGAAYNMKGGWGK
eukprot:s2296_g7.t2